MKELLKDLISVFVPVYVAIDVFALLPIFLSFTVDQSREGIRKIINQSILTSLFVSLGFVAIGKAIFEVIGITVDDFKIAGGIVLLIIAVLEVVGTGTGLKKNAVSQAAGVVPIAVPMIVGPALLTTLLVLLEQYGLWLTLGSLLINLLIVWLLFRNASKVVRMIGKDGITAMSKLVAILLAAIAIMMVRLGLENVITTLK